MQPAVIQIFPTFTKPLEGCVLWPYLDVLGIPTVGYGCALESAADAVAQHWEGAPSADSVRAQYADLKSQTRLAKLHFNYAAAVTTLRLSQAGADALLVQRVGTFETELRKWFPGWDEFSADAQLAIMAMAWACGPAFAKTFTNFARFANAHDWTNAAKCAAIRADGNAGIVPRNAQVQLCLANAATEPSAGGLLYWPNAAQDADNQIRIAAFEALQAHPIDVLGYAGRADPFTDSQQDSQ